MAYKTSSSLLARVFLISILLAIAGQAIAVREIPRNSADDDQMKQPEWLLKNDPSVLIPGIGRVMLPPPFKPYLPYPGSSGGGSTGAVGHIPGGDDTFVPNPGFEVPTPGNGAGTVPHP